MAECNVTIGVDVVDLGSEVNKRIRFSTTSDPEAMQVGYGTVATANTMETLDLGQVAASLVDMIYIKAIANNVYVSPGSVASTGPLLKIPAGEANVFRPYFEGAVAVSVGITADTDETAYEYIVVGQSS